MSQEEAPHKIYFPSSSGALRQGEILSDLVQASLRFDTIWQDQPVVKTMEHPLAIVVTQDCDLEQDFKARTGQNATDKLIPSVLFCQMTTAEGLRGQQGITSEIWKRIRNNKDERYHFLQKVEATHDALNKGLSELGVDFKRYFTIPTDEVYERLVSEAKRRCRLVSPYLEHFSTRFAYYQFRVALPSDHFSEPVSS